MRVLKVQVHIFKWDSCICRIRASRNPRDGLRTITDVLKRFRETVRGIGPHITHTQDWLPHHDKVPDSTDLFFRIY